jgi:hypothetical protein
MKMTVRSIDPEEIPVMDDTINPTTTEAAQDAIFFSEPPPAVVVTATGDVRSASSVLSVSSVGDGEYHQLIHSLEDDDLSSPLPEKVVAALHRELSLQDLKIATTVVDDDDGGAAVATTTTETLTNHVPTATTNVVTNRNDALASKTTKVHASFEFDTTVWYGHPLSTVDAQEQMPATTMGNVESATMTTTTPSSGSGGCGLIWNATIIPDESLVATNGPMKLCAGLSPRDFISTPPSTSVLVRIKPRRPSLPLTAKEFFSSLTRVDALNSSSTRKRSRYIFHGVLNGWPGLRTMELLSLECRRNSSTVLPSPREFMKGQILWVQVWSMDDPDRNYENVDTLVHQNRVYRAKLRGAPWTGIGWSKDSPGFCFWYEAQRADGPRVTFGTRMVSELSNRDSLCTQVHMISHRYAVDRVESPRDRLTYHSICLLEWDHGLYCTVVETAYLNGMGGYKCKSNWYDDKDAEPVTSLFQAFPPEMVCPWRTSQSEMRCYDVAAKNLLEFRTYMSKYEGSPPKGRFIDVHCTFSHAARLTFRSKAHIAQYLINYILRDSSYGELNRNCQTFAADLCSFLAGKKGVAPFHPVNRIEYQNRNHLFLYDSHLYEKKTTTKSKYK